MAELILSADLGGTNSRFAVFQESRRTLVLQDKISFSTADVASFAQLLSLLRESELGPFLSQARVSVLAVAGPVERNGYCDPPNIPWDLDLKRDGQDLPRPLLLNDFEAQAFACVSPRASGAQVILPGRAQRDATLACMGAGTGLGKCALVRVRGHFDGHISVPSEGGHALFPLVDEQDLALAEFIREKTGARQVTGDLVVSGPGLRLLHQFLTGEDKNPADITRHADPDSPTLSTFARYYGRACRQYALEVLSLGGLFITGGMATKAPIVVTHPAFAREFQDSETYGRLLRKIPVRLMKNEDSGLWGAAMLGHEMLQAERAG